MGRILYATFPLTFPQLLDHEAIDVMTETDESVRDETWRARMPLNRNLRAWR